MRKCTKENRREAGILLVYCLIFGLFLFKMFYYMEEIWDVPDEEAHISYIIYLEREEKLIPEFENMKLYSRNTVNEEGVSLFCEDSEIVCYLGHPPLYYKLMQLLGAVSIEGAESYVDEYVLKTANIVLTALTMLIAFTAGYSRLRRMTDSVCLHALYAMAATSVPMLGLCGSGVTNDNLANLGMALFLLGVFRYYEGEKGYVTYFLTGAGFFLSCMSKLTSAELAGIVLAVVFAAEIIRNRNIQIIWNRRFAATLPFYLLTAGYFILIFSRYGSIQPGLEIVAPEQLVTVPEAEREVLDIWGYVNHFLLQFRLTWSGIYTAHFGMMKQSLLKVRLPFYLMALGLPVMTVLGIRQGRRTDRGELPLWRMQKIPYLAVLIAVGITFLTQLIKGYQSYLDRGYMGGYQARYFLCLVPVLAFAFAETGTLVRSRFGKRLVAVLAAGFSLWLLRSDFYYFLASYQAYFS